MCSNRLAMLTKLCLPSWRQMAPLVCDSNGWDFFSTHTYVRTYIVHMAHGSRHSEISNSKQPLKVWIRSLKLRSVLCTAQSLNLYPMPLGYVFNILFCCFACNRSFHLACASIFMYYSFIFHFIPFSSLLRFCFSFSAANGKKTHLQFTVFRFHLNFIRFWKFDFFLISWRLKKTHVFGSASNENCQDYNF